MDKNLKNALLIIAVLVGLYYFISPYENCMRTQDKMGLCTRATNW